MNFRRRRSRTQLRSGYDDYWNVHRQPPPVEDPTPRRTTSKRPRPWLIEMRWKHHWSVGDDSWRAWRRHGRYRTERERDDALRSLERSWGQSSVELRRAVAS